MKTILGATLKTKDKIKNLKIVFKTKRRAFKAKIREVIFGNPNSRKALKKLEIQKTDLVRMIKDQARVDYYEWKYPNFPTNDKVKRFIWFVPDWLNVWGGGHYTLFRFANHFSNQEEGIQNIIFIYNDSGRRAISEIEKDLKSAVQNCKLKVITNPELLPSCEAAFATTWQSAYDVSAFPHAKKKFYFMQDYESLFYAYGTESMQAINSYKMGFIGITGGTWLRQTFESYGGKAQNYVFSTDKDIFYPSNKGKVRDRVLKIFFYGRPSTERRCFSLGINVLEKISKKYPDIEIVIAGLQIEEGLLPFKATLLGNLTLKETGELYRSCDVGIAFSGTNLSYLPVELMASGCPVLTNNGLQTEWYCNSENSILVDPVAKAVLEGFDNLYNSKELRQKIVDKGLEKSAQTSWEKEMGKIYSYVISNL